MIFFYPALTVQVRLKYLRQFKVEELILLKNRQKKEKKKERKKERRKERRTPYSFTHTDIFPYSSGAKLRFSLSLSFV